MTAKDIFKKVTVYNEIAGYCHESLKKVKFMDEWLISEYFISYAFFKQWVKETYIPEVAEAILQYDEFEIRKVCDINYINKFGEEKIMYNIEFDLFDRY